MGKVCDHIMENELNGRHYAIVVVGEAPYRWARGRLQGGQAKSAGRTSF
jgi:hypothetical protein